MYEMDNQPKEDNYTYLSIPIIYIILTTNQPVSIDVAGANSETASIPNNKLPYLHLLKDRYKILNSP